eukprot:TRINITY_DN232_c0_g1_i9.p2 TRINITY_DN232_c0_g1~~TRINITY_DN232_c0_g1_i9.p2  ORF type:complete len:106 (-),score=10.01 TRINITY_DN232_c0_g1_i9:174-491(-)
MRITFVPELYAFLPLPLLEAPLHLLASSVALAFESVSKAAFGIHHFQQPLRAHSPCSRRCCKDFATHTRGREILPRTLQTRPPSHATSTQTPPTALIFSSASLVK